MAFEAHGEVKMYWRGSILVIEPSGSINREGSMGFSKSVITHIESKPSRLWCRLEYIKDLDTLGTPGAADDFRDTLIYCKNNGCRKMSWVGGNSLVRKQFKLISEQIGIPCQEYPDFDHAIADLTSLTTEFGN